MRGDEGPCPRSRGRGVTEGVPQLLRHPAQQPRQDCLALLRKHDVDMHRYKDNIYTYMNMYKLVERVQIGSDRNCQTNMP